MLNDFHSRACGGHLTRMAIAQKPSVLAISGLLSLKILMRLLRNAHLVNTSILKSAPILLCYTPSLMLAHSPNGGLTSCIVSLPHSGGIVKE